MFSFSVSIVIIATIGWLSAVVTPVDGFMNAPRKIVGISRSSRQIGNANEWTRCFHSVDCGVGTRRSIQSKRCHSVTNSRVRTPTVGRAPRKTSASSTLSSSRQHRLFSSFSPIDDLPSSRRSKPRAVHLLILLSFISFVGDNICHLPVFRSFYLFHRNWKWWQPVTSMFCHADRAHLSGNMFLLLLFGRSVEDENGSFGVMLSYLFCGVTANLVSLAMLPSNTVGLGASGAVFGLFSVSILSRVSSLQAILDWHNLIEVGVLGQFVVERFLNEAKTAATGGIGGVNHVAHLAGAGAGIAMILILRILLRIMEKE